MAGNNLAAAANTCFIHMAPDPDVLMAVGHRHGLVVGLVAHQGLCRHVGVGLVAGIEARCLRGPYSHQHASRGDSPRDVGRMRAFAVEAVIVGDCPGYRISVST